MSRGTIGFIYQETLLLAYNNDYSEPDVLGEDCLDFIARVNEENGWNKLKDNLKHFKPMPSDYTLEECGLEWIIKLYDNILTEYPIDNNFITESYCDYGYIINLDTMFLEYYVGYQTKPQTGNRFGTISKDGTYYPCRLGAIFNLKDINYLVDFISLVERMIEIDNSGKDDKSIINLFRKPKLDKIYGTT